MWEDTLSYLVIGGVLAANSGVFQKHHLVTKDSL
jgi:hypothetical protein